MQRLSLGETLAASSSTSARRHERQKVKHVRQPFRTSECGPRPPHPPRRAAEADVDAALREVRRALLEADVALDVARAFTDDVKKQAVGVEVMKSVTPGQMVVKIVHDQLVATLGADARSRSISTPRRRSPS